MLFTLALYYYGPVPWTSSGEGLVAVVVLSALLFFNLGSYFGRRLPALSSQSFTFLDGRNNRWLLASVFVLLSAFHTYDITGRLLFDPTAYSTDFNLVYQQFLENLDERTSSLVSQLLLLLKAALMPAIILVMVIAFRKENLLIALIFFPFAASSMLRSTDKETVDLMLFLFVLYYYHGLLQKRFLRVAGLVVLILVLFYARKLARFEDVDLQCLPGSPEACFNFNNWLSTQVSPGLEFMRIMFTNYLTQGYEGMARALHIPWEFNWGLGHMAPVKAQMCRVLDVACDLNGFADKLPDRGWDTRFKWSSVYTALANDFHWIFVPFYTGTLGVLFGVSEKSWRRNGDRLSLACLLLITLFFVYSSANMQLAVSLEWTAVYLVLFVWQWARILSRAPATAHYDGQYAGSSVTSRI
ncbi:hypothetical protein OB2597_13033 [Pseudooceanicola batsensis HTCC2597]|uniref:Oligosaccharide repeat unit polymerase n=1 Tax=Pseudooceanicola batsensis (strain ATCC BAA-863 / DSM 15984 / KCTC 12145 / HTCC2597) TaxID=252305 RepID=A3TY35_PSEBH|nr:hypothetical protein OB2597_13033 [Pseudooceanicola batsensis HTCC2597]